MDIEQIEESLQKNAPAGTIVNVLSRSEDTSEPGRVVLTVSYQEDVKKETLFGGVDADEIIKKLDNLKNKAKTMISACSKDDELPHILSELLGTDGDLISILRQLGELQPNRRKELGEKINETVNYIKNEYLDKATALVSVSDNSEDLKNLMNDMAALTGLKDSLIKNIVFCGVKERHDERKWCVETCPGIHKDGETPKVNHNAGWVRQLKDIKKSSPQARIDEDSWGKHHMALRKMEQDRAEREKEWADVAKIANYKTPKVDHDADWLKQLKEIKTISQQARAEKDKIYQEALEDFSKKTGRSFSKQELKRGDNKFYTSPNTVTEVEVMATKKLSEKFPNQEKSVNLKSWLREAKKVQAIIDAIPSKPTLLERIKTKFFDKKHRQDTMRRHHLWLSHIISKGGLRPVDTEAVAGVSPVIRTVAKEIQRLVSEGDLQPEDVDKLIEYGASAEAISCWKSVYCCKTKTPKKSLVLKIKELFGNKPALKDCTKFVNMFIGASKQAEAIQQLVIDGKLLSSDVDKLLEYGVSEKSVKYWKSVYNFGPFKGKKMPTVAELEFAIRDHISPGYDYDEKIDDLLLKDLADLNELKADLDDKGLI